MDKDMLDMFNLLINKIDGTAGMEQSLKREIAKTEGMEQRLEAKLEKRISESETRIMVYMENNIGKRIDALVDGYKTNYEMNDQTSQRVDVLEDKVDTLQDRVVILENAG